MHAPVLLISTDFDGTLVEHGNPAPFSEELVEILTVLRGRGVRWVVNTGRSLPWLDDGLKSFGIPIHPDFAITAERALHQRDADGRGWRDLGDWNTRCEQRHRAMFAEAAPLLAEVIRFVEGETRAELRFGRYGFTDNSGTRDPRELVGLVATSSEEMDTILAFVDARRGALPDFSYQRNSIYLSFCHRDYDKGTTLAELGRQIGVPRESIFAVGDHQNDLAMLTGEHAGHVACPGNSIEEVKRTVRAAGGYVASAGYSAGVIEALRFYCGDLPAWTGCPGQTA